VIKGAACAGVDTSVFFPRPTDAAAVEAAKDICRACPVLRPCLMQALRHADEHAILGATTPEERRLIRRRLARGRARMEVAA
jgi:WhiB family redox-sensing transcriptional regulator